MKSRKLLWKSKVNGRTHYHGQTIEALPYLVVAVWSVLLGILIGILLGQ